MTRGKKLDGIFKVVQTRVDGLVQDLRIRRDGLKYVAEKPEGLLRLAPILELTHDVIDIVETDSGNMALDFTTFGK